MGGALVERMIIMTRAHRAKRVVRRFNILYFFIFFVLSLPPSLRVFSPKTIANVISTTALVLLPFELAGSEDAAIAFYSLNVGACFSLCWLIAEGARGCGCGL